MFELILSAVILGFMLSLVFIGPIFFLLIETSFSRGPKHALALDIGVISADLLCILAAYYASADIVTLIDKHPGFYRITAILIFVYGIVMMVTKTKMHIPGEEKFINQNYFKTFINGFFFNLLNVGVILFWLVTVISVRNQYPNTGNFILYIGIVIGTYLLIDLAKIFLAKQFHDKLTQKLANKIRRIVGGILIVFSFFIFLQSFKKFNQFDKRLEEAEKTEVKYQKQK
ncbi:LysE family transporter [Chryseobacterium sp. POE27]|uniref:LysE family translocator n=1 Tax=Chryseobacterium sp. POE27 TaxID=3138177 RepID=UPI00321C38CC